MKHFILIPPTCMLFMLLQAAQLKSADLQILHLIVLQKSFTEIAANATKKAVGVQKSLPEGAKGEISRNVTYLEDFVADLSGQELLSVLHEPARYANEKALLRTTFMSYADVFKNIGQYMPDDQIYLEQVKARFNKVWQKIDAAKKEQQAISAKPASGGGDGAKPLKNLDANDIQGIKEAARQITEMNALTIKYWAVYGDTLMNTEDVIRVRLSQKQVTQTTIDDIVKSNLAPYSQNSQQIMRSFIELAQKHWNDIAKQREITPLEKSAL